MSNHLKVAIIDTIASLYRRGLSQRRIARELEIDRERSHATSSRLKPRQNQPMRPSARATPRQRQNQPMRLRLG